MDTSLKNKVEIAANSEPKALLSLEISESGLRRVVVYADPGDPEEQTAAFALLARISAQLTLIDAVLKDSAAKAAEEQG